MSCKSVERDGVQSPSRNPYSILKFKKKDGGGRTREKGLDVVFILQGAT